MTQHLVSRTKTARSLQKAISEFGGKRFQIGVQSGEDLLTVGVADRDGADACTDATQGSLMQVKREGVAGASPGRGGHCTKHGGMVPVDRGSSALAKSGALPGGPGPSIG